MRLDYVLYAVAIIFFITTLAAVVYYYSVEQVWVVIPAVIGLAFIGLGYTQRPKTTALPTAEVPAPPPSAPPSQPQQQQQELVLATTAPPEPAKVEEVKPTVEQPLISGLTAVKGIGEKRAAQLKTLGINTVEDLVKASPEDLASKLRISPKITGKWIESAKEILQKP
jgi:predicted flap endonuclease-1-like 5' DNA nuclease